uniref:C-type lectin domain-containing protein n=1 Tax=Branchiostoma floridae TaxID=7739 RepID=C3YJH3_BRAFL|eukprot:XP_002603561.1 hypothetical protein BRAFLDRAFT_122248 [Branchiostoma floridae]
MSKSGGQQQSHTGDTTGTTHKQHVQDDWQAIADIAANIPNALYASRPDNLGPNGHIKHNMTDEKVSVLVYSESRGIETSGGLSWIFRNPGATAPPGRPRDGGHMEEEHQTGTTESAGSRRLTGGPDKAEPSGTIETTGAVGTETSTYSSPDGPTEQPETSTTRPSNGGCIEGFTLWRGTCYKVFIAPQNYEDSSATCRQLGGTLAMPRDADTNAFLISSLINATTFTRPNNVRFGLHDQRQEGRYEWVDGTPLRKYMYNSWAPYGNVPGGDTTMMFDKADQTCKLISKRGAQESTFEMKGGAEIFIQNPQGLKITIKVTGQEMKVHANAPNGDTTMKFDTTKYTCEVNRPSRNDNIKHANAPNGDTTMKFDTTKYTCEVNRPSRNDNIKHANAPNGDTTMKFDTTKYTCEVNRPSRNDNIKAKHKNGELQAAARKGSKDRSEANTEVAGRYGVDNTEVEGRNGVGPPPPPPRQQDHKACRYCTPQVESRRSPVTVSLQTVVDTVPPSRVKRSFPSLMNVSTDNVITIAMDEFLDNSGVWLREVEDTSFEDDTEAARHVYELIKSHIEGLDRCAAKGKILSAGENDEVVLNHTREALLGMARLQRRDCPQGQPKKRTYRANAEPVINRLAEDCCALFQFIEGERNLAEIKKMFPTSSQTQTFQSPALTRSRTLSTIDEEGDHDQDVVIRILAENAKLRDQLKYELKETNERLTKMEDITKRQDKARADIADECDRQIQSIQFALTDNKDAQSKQQEDIDSLKGKLKRIETNQVKMNTSMASYMNRIHSLETEIQACIRKTNQDKDTTAEHDTRKIEEAHGRENIAVLPGPAPRARLRADTGKIEEVHGRENIAVLPGPAPRARLRADTGKIEEVHGRENIAVLPGPAPRARLRADTGKIEEVHGAGKYSRVAGPAPRAVLPVPPVKLRKHT